MPFLCLVAALSPVLVSPRSPQAVAAQPASDFDLTAARGRCVELLLACQEDLDGGDARREWPYEGVYRVGGAIPIGYRVGGTAIAAWALIESPAVETAEVRAAVSRALDYLFEALEDERMAPGFRGSYDVRGWGHAYALHFLLRLRTKELVSDDEAFDVDTWIDRLVGTLQETVLTNGGWSYSRGQEDASPASPFMTAPTLLALFEAQRAGEAVDAEVVERSLDVLAAARTESGAVPYTTAGGRDAWPGAIGRTPATELALHAAGRSSVERIATSLDRFFEHWNELEKRRRQNGTHVPPYGVAPYYFFYAHGYAALAIEAVARADAPRAAKLRARLLERLIEVREPSGGWNDRVFARSENYGTAMALVALCAPDFEAPATWSPVD